MIINNNINEVNIICDEKIGESYMDIGVIGGADGPTTIFVTSNTGSYTIAAIAIICIAVVGIIVYIVRRRKNK